MTLTGGIVNVFAHLKSERGHPTKMALPPGITRRVPCTPHTKTAPPWVAVLFTHVNLARRNLTVLNSIPDPNEDLNVLVCNLGPDVEYIEHGDLLAHLAFMQLPSVELLE